MTNIVDVINTNKILLISFVLKLLLLLFVIKLTNLKSCYQILSKTQNSVYSCLVYFSYCNGFNKKQF